MMQSRYILRLSDGLARGIASRSRRRCRCRRCLCAVVVVGRQLGGQVLAGVGEVDDLHRQRAGRPLRRDPPGARPGAGRRSRRSRPAPSAAPAGVRKARVCDDPAASSHSGDQRRFRNTSLIRANQRSYQTCSSAPAATCACSESRSAERRRMRQRLRGGPPRALPAAPAAGLLDEAVLRERPQVERAVGGRLAERLAGLGRGQRGVHAEQLDQRHPDRVREGAHHGRVGDAHRLPLVALGRRGRMGGAGWFVGSELTFRNTTLETVLLTRSSEDFFRNKSSEGAPADRRQIRFVRMT